MINNTTKFLVVGLGLLGGSYAKALKQKEYYVSALDINPNSIEYALNNGIIDKGSTDDVSLISEADVVIIGLYPTTMVEWMREHQQYFKPGTMITDVSGVKCHIIDEIQNFLREDVEFIAAHPMAGKEVKGVEYADGNMFLPANFIITPTEKNTDKGIEFIYDLANILRFKRITKLTPQKHDEMIAFLSQLPHVIAVCLMTCRESEHLIAYTGDSFRDLTRIAKINEDLWSELFTINKDVLLSQMDLFMDEFMAFRDKLANDDTEGMKDTFRLSTKRRKEFDK